jgi:peptidoglycan/xylan/chitin deacetylase (PgdA/CDA1 family)
MNLTPVKTPLVIKKLFPNFIWDITSNSKEIYLTFDDGPTPEITNWTLDILRQYRAKATFFCVGNNVEKFPEIFQNIIDEGHAVGNHTYHHLKGWKTSTEDYLKDIQKAQDLINSKLFRPPYGQITPKQGLAIMALGYHVILWNVLSIDWDVFVSRKTCLNNVISKADSGSIIVFHDSVKASKNMQYALPLVLKHFTEKGFTFKAL